MRPLSAISGLVGFGVGCVVVLVLVAADLYGRGLGVSVSSLVLLHQTNPALWLADLMPLHLAISGVLLERAIRPDPPPSAAPPAPVPVPPGPPAWTGPSGQLDQLRSDLDDARRESVAKSAFLAGMSHELRTPLNAILGYAELMNEELAEDGIDRREDFDRILSSGRYLLQLLNNILDLSKLEAGKMSVVLEPIPLKTAFSDLVDTVQPVVEKNGNTLTTRVDLGIEAARGDAMRLRQVLVNLVGNAAKFTENGTIEVVAEAHADHQVAIRVRDTGIGMTPEQVGRLFQEYVQADSDIKRKYGGTGLGLTLSKRFVEMMGGEISVTSAPGEGSTFTVVLLSASRRDPSRSSIQDLPNRRVLVVDEEHPTLRTLLRRRLSAAGFLVEFADTGEDALQAVASSPPLVVLLDVHMEGGWRTLKTLAEVAPDVVVIVLSADVDAERAANAGARVSLEKPVDAAQLMREIQDAVE